MGEFLKKGETCPAGSQSGALPPSQGACVGAGWRAARRIISYSLGIEGVAGCPPHPS